MELFVAGLQIHQEVKRGGGEWTHDSGVGGQLGENYAARRPVMLRYDLT